MATVMSADRLSIAWLIGTAGEIGEELVEVGVRLDVAHAAAALGVAFVSGDEKLAASGRLDCRQYCSHRPYWVHDVPDRPLVCRPEFDRGRSLALGTTICRGYLEVFRAEDGTAVALDNRSSHRGSPLSAGALIGDSHGGHVLWFRLLAGLDP